MARAWGGKHPRGEREEMCPWQQSHEEEVHGSVAVLLDLLGQECQIRAWLRGPIEAWSSRASEACLLVARLLGVGTGSQRGQRCCIGEAFLPRAWTTRVGKSCGHALSLYPAHPDIP